MSIKGYNTLRLIQLLSYKTTKTNRGCCAMKGKGCKGCSAQKHSSYDWLNDIPEALQSSQMVEVQFKNTRKSYFRNSLGLDLSKGDIVAVEASSGYDIGTVTLTGKMVELAIRKHRWRPDKDEVHRILRLALPADIDRWHEAQAKEEPTMIQSRQIASNLGLDMKIGDVEYQGDGNKAIFYYIADGRVDFRQLIRVLADTFHIRIEMKQIGARQEAGRIGGIGPCGRELCCSGWMSNFVSVNTHAARLQDLSLNPQKLTGMCGKLKCCMNYEVNAYVEAQRSLPSRDQVLETKKGKYYHFKTDVFARMISYSLSPSYPQELVTINAKRAFDVIRMNEQGELPDALDLNDERKRPSNKPKDILSDNSLTRFDKKLGVRSGKRGRDNSQANRFEGNGQQRRERSNAHPKQNNSPRGEGRTRQPYQAQGGERRAPRERRPMSDKREKES